MLKSTTPERKASIGEAIGASFCVALASFIGVIFLVPGFGFLAKQYNFLHGIDAFASGAIISFSRVNLVSSLDSVCGFGGSVPFHPLKGEWDIFFLFAGLQKPGFFLPTRGGEGLVLWGANP